ncbi:MAG TPA: 6-phosphogluconolactonase [Candidatus Dormibacteraeota bacterium]|jgi:6-phosphogluconolactonase|nr:6-phosphogluconolactonase [Candidatus Dormibacteraeota bacterium]
MTSTSPSVHVFDDPEGLARRAADLVAEAVRAGARTLVLAGGSTPRRAYQLLATEPLPWGRVTVLFGDERCVPPDHPESNYRMAKRELLDHVHPGSLHRIPGELGAEAAAARYDTIVRSLTPLDLVLLGMGPDGHTASLFPGHAALHAAGYAVAVHDAPKPPPERVSLTLGALREARQVVVLVAGEDKAAALARARRGEVPAGMIPGARYLVDRAAVGRAVGRPGT